VQPSWVAAVLKPGIGNSVCAASIENRKFSIAIRSFEPAAGSKLGAPA
jgi:hypothetical protein